MEDWRTKDYTIASIIAVIGFAIWLVTTHTEPSKESMVKMITDKSFEIKISSLKIERNLVITGTTRFGNDTVCTIPYAWGHVFNLIAIGDSVIKPAGKKEIKLVKKDTIMFLPIVLADGDTIRVKDRIYVYNGNNTFNTRNFL